MLKIVLLCVLSIIIQTVISISFETDTVRTGVSRFGIGQNAEKATKTINFFKMVKNSKSSDTAQLYDGDVAEFVSALNREDCVQMMNVEYFPKDAYATIPPNRTVSIHLKTVEELPEWFKKRIMNIEMAN